jgi:hypothetical protein
MHLRGVGGPEPGFWGAGVGNGGWYHQGAYQNGHYAGIQDAIYDHENNLVYTDQPSCLLCYSQLYLDGFKHGYDQQPPITNIKIRNQLSEHQYTFTVTTTM